MLLFVNLEEEEQRVGRKNFSIHFGRNRKSLSAIILKR